MNGSKVLNLFSDLLVPKGRSKCQGNTVIKVNELFHKVLAKEIHESHEPVDHQVRRKGRQELSQKEKKLIASFAGLFGLKAVVPQTKADILSTILKKLGLGKEQIFSVLTNATDSSGLIHLDKLARCVESILRDRADKGSCVTIGREFVPLLALSFLRLGAEVEAVKNVLERYTLEKSELKLADVSAMIHDLAPGLQLTDEDTKALLHALGIPTKPEDITSFMKESELSREVKHITKSKDMSSDTVAKTKLALILRSKGVAPEKVKEILETVNFEELKGGLKQEKKKEITNSEIESLLKSIKTDHKGNNDRSSIKQHLANARLKSPEKGNTQSVTEQSDKQRIQAMPNSTIEKPKGAQVDVGRVESSNSLKGDGKGDFAFAKLVDKAKQPPITIPSQGNIQFEDSVTASAPVYAKWVDPNETIEKLVQQLKIMLAGRQHVGRITLHPPELGQMDLKVVAKHGHLEIQLAAQHPWAKEIVEGNLNGLRQQLNQAGFVVDKFEVMVGLGGGGYTPQWDQEMRQGWRFQARDIKASGPSIVSEPPQSPGLMISHSHNFSVVV